MVSSASRLCDRLVAAGIPCTEIANHDDSEWGISDAMHPGVFVRSVYFQDPDGILLEFACWLRDFSPADVSHVPATAPDAGSSTSCWTSSPSSTVTCTASGALAVMRRAK